MWSGDDEKIAVEVHRQAPFPEGVLRLPAPRREVELGNEKDAGNACDPLRWLIQKIPRALRAPRR